MESQPRHSSRWTIVLAGLLATPFVYVGSFLAVSFLVNCDRIPFQWYLSSCETIYKPLVYYENSTVPGGSRLLSLESWFAYRGARMAGKHP